MQNLIISSTSAVDVQSLIDAFAGIHKRLDSIESELPASEQQTIFITRQEVAVLLKVFITTVWSYTKVGLLRAYRMGNKVVYKKHEVEEAPIPTRRK
ncbi:helix-turn-helix domain-containing protein [Nibrella saemangeumensis]|uniref:helix-turn-helix domain-containing protein n=1 Tax=Nibrella saemangeumensis TaxID=1084526 RepID=UPI0031ED5765